MAGGKETPRQKMIGMMYLVLLALLAMNVSKQIVMAFVTLTNKMEVQNESVVAANVNAINKYTEAELVLKNSGAKPEEMKDLQKWKEKASAAHESSKYTVNFIMDLADEMLQAGSAGEWIKVDGHGYKGITDLGNHENDYGKKDDYDTPTRMFVGEGRGDKIIARIYEFRDSMAVAMTMDMEKGNVYEPVDIVRKTNDDTTYLVTLKEALVEQGVGLDVHDAIIDLYRNVTFPEVVDNHGEEVPWVQGQFDHAPIVAAAAMLTSIKGQVLQAEKVVLDFYSTRTEMPSFKFNKIEPLAYASTSYINTGDSLSLRVMIAAYDSTAETRIQYWVDDSTMSPENMKETDMNTFTLGRDLGSEIGDHYVYAKIEVEEKGQKKWKTVPKPFKYKVGAPSSAIGNAEMNVMYIGYDNIIAASGSGYTDVTASCNGCASWGKQGEMYKARVTAGRRTVTVSLSGKDKDGNTASIATQEFRVLPMPRPRVYVIGVDPFASNIARSALAAGYLRAELIGSPLTIASQVTGGAVTVTVQGVSQTYPMQGNKIPAAAANIIRQLRPGATVMIETTCLLGGAPVKPAPISYKVT